MTTAQDQSCLNMHKMLANCMNLLYYTVATLIYIAFKARFTYAWNSYVRMYKNCMHAPVVLAC